MQEPVVAGGVFAQPGLDQIVHFSGALAAAGELVAVELCESGGEPPGKMPLGEAGERNRVPTPFLQVAHPHRRGRIVKMSLSGIAQVLGRPDMPDHAVLDSETGREERGAAGIAGVVGNVGVGEDGAGCRNLVDYRRGRTVVAVAAQVVGAGGIDVDVEEAHGRSATLVWGASRGTCQDSTSRPLRRRRSAACSGRPWASRYSRYCSDEQ